MFFNDVIKLLNDPVGNNLTNNPEDIETVKTQLRTLGRYDVPETNGYIDRKLNDAIWQFQKDYDLKRDGKMNPGGKTEATLAGSLMGIERPKERRQDNVRMAAAAAPAIFTRIAPLLSATAMAAQEWWQSRDKKEREDTVENVRQEEEKRKQECDRRNEEHMRECDEVKKRKGNRSAAVCRQSANEIYAACLAGKPEDDCPPLQR